MLADKAVAVSNRRSLSRDRHTTRPIRRNVQSPLPERNRSPVKREGDGWRIIGGGVMLGNSKCSGLYRRSKYVNLSHFQKQEGSLVHQPIKIESWTYDMNTSASRNRLKSLASPPNLYLGHQDHQRENLTFRFHLKSLSYQKEDKILRTLSQDQNLRHRRWECRHCRQHPVCLCMQRFN
jgi:hypothetical protein